MSGPLDSLLSRASQLSWQVPRASAHPGLPGAHCGERLVDGGESPARVPFGLRTSHRRTGIADDYDILVYWHSGNMSFLNIKTAKSI